MKHAGATGGADPSGEDANQDTGSEKSDSKSKDDDIVDADFEVVDDAEKKD